MLVDVALPVPLRTSFTYAVPERLRDGVRRGVRVRVPFGPRKLVGVVLGPAQESSDLGEVKEVEAVLDRSPLLPETILEVSQWIAAYYQAPIGDSVRMALPPGDLQEGRRAGRSGSPRQQEGALREGAEPERADEREGQPASGDRSRPLTIEMARLAPGKDAGSLALDRRAVALRAVLDALTAHAQGDGWMTVEDLLRLSGASTSHLKRLRDKGWVELATAEAAPQVPAAGPEAGKLAHEGSAVSREAGAPSDTGTAPEAWAASRAADGPDAGRLAHEGSAASREAGAASASGPPREVSAGSVVAAHEEAAASRAPASSDARGPAPDTARETAMFTTGLVPGPTLTPAQQEAAARIVGALDAGESQVFVLRGVTGSGKTEVYFAAARRALDRGRSVLFLVPEIGLTPALTRHVLERFGDQVAVVHSRLTPKERRESWNRAREGRAPLVVGPRSALFAPVSRLGLLVVDEEHDPSYKQEEAPRYHARDIALVRARLEGAVTVLGSATPSLESWHGASTGRFERLELRERIGGRPLPAVEIIDMREEFRRRGAPVILSSALVSALLAAKERGEQAVILLNRRGYAAFALCRACGEPIGCPRCSVSLVYHRSDETLRCHYCDHRCPRPEICPTCASPHLVFQGEGTERVERHLGRELPGLRVTRLDRDTARGRGAHERILSEFESGAQDVLIGTQMVAKGHDFPNVTVVGVLAADAILGFPDFRAAERTFQLLTQVAGRAGRGDRPGQVLVQAYRRDHYALQAAARHDHQEFFSKELVYRRALAYPPFSNLAAVTVLGKDLAAASKRARIVAARLSENGGGRVQVLGPAIAPIARLRGVYRFQILLKARARGRLGDALRRSLDSLALEKGGTRDLIVDVDPLQLL